MRFSYRISLIAILAFVLGSSRWLNVQCESEKIATDSLYNASTTSENGYQIVLRDGIKYIISDGEERQLLSPLDRNQIFPTSVCEDQAVDIILNLQATMNLNCVGSSYAYLCVSLWEEDSGVLPDERVTADYCAYFPTDGYRTATIQYTFQGVVLSNWIIGDPGGSGEFYVRVNGDCISGNAQTVPEGVALSSGSLPGQVSTPTASPNATCVNTPYTVSWGAISGATFYQVSVNDGPWQDVGNVSSKVFSNTSAGSYTYEVRAGNTCGLGNPSGGRVVTIYGLPSAPSSLSCSPPSPCAGQQLCVS